MRFLMTETPRFAVAALAAGAAGVFVSENLFWSAPRPGFSPGDWVLAWIAYALAAAVGLAAVAVTGCGGWRGLFLGGALFGFVTEGVLVDTMYDAFPVQLVWTPLAWHALLSALAAGGIARSAAARGAGRQAAAWIALGLMFGGFALYWPAEWGGRLPAGPEVLAYLAGYGLALPVAHAVLDRIGTVPRPPGYVLLAAPLMAAGIWAVKTVLAPDPVRLAMPVMAALTFWAMVRLGDRAAPVSLGAAAPAWKHALALLMPLTAAAVAITLWPLTGGLPANLVMLAISAPAGLGLWLWLLWRAYRARAESAADRSIAPS